MREEAVQSLRDFYEVIERLRAPGGCPWDREQTHATLAPYLLEETYEVLEAIDGDSHHALREELGDVLLQVFMHSTIAAEVEDGFDIGDVADVVREKMVHRHPHVFGDVVVDGAADVVVNWEKLKSAEKSDRESILDGVPRTLPALAHAQAIQKRPARLGFDHVADADAAVAGAQLALAAVAQSLAGREPAVTGEDWVVREGEIARGDDAGIAQEPPATQALNAAMGDLLFAVASLARLARINAEDVLRRTTNEFAQRFRDQEAAARSQGKQIHDMTAADWDALAEHKM